MQTQKRKENAVSIKYMKVVRVFLSTIGMWPGEIIGEHEPIIVRCQRYFIIIASILLTFGGFYYICTKSNDLSLFEKGSSYITSLFSVVILFRLLWTRLQSYGEVTKTFLVSFHLINFRGKGVYYKEMFNTIDRVTLYFAAYVMTTTFLAFIFYNSVPAFLNYKNGIFTGNNLENASIMFSVTYSFPGFEQSDHFIVIMICNVLYTYCALVSICMFDLLNLIMVFQIIGHIKVLKNRLESFPKPKKQNIVEFSTPNSDVCFAAVEMYDAEENRSAHEILVQCIDHHKFIVSFSDQLSSFYGPPIALNYLFQLITLCIMLLECSQGDPQALMQFVPLTVITFGDLIQKSVVFETLNTVSESVIDSVYAVPWEFMDVRNRRTVCILLHRVQSPIKITAMGMVPVGVTTMASILKTTFSYFMLLRSMGSQT